MKLDTLMHTRGAFFVTRYHNVPTRRESSVAEHSYGVANLVLYLTNGEASAALLRAALHHDIAEISTGDIPAPVKRDKPEVKAAIVAWEDELNAGLGIMQDNLTAREASVLKFADSYEGLLYTMEEYDMGNTLILPVLLRWVEYLEENPQGASDEGLELMQYYRMWANRRGYDQKGKMNYE